MEKYIYRVYDNKLKQYRDDIFMDCFGVLIINECMVAHGDFKIEWFLENIKE